jgi:hypothetical protein
MMLSQMQPGQECSTSMSEVRNVKVSLTLPEDLVASFEKRGQAVNLTAHTLMTRLLKSLKDVEVTDRLLWLTTCGRRTLEALAETTIGNEDQLIDLYKRLAEIGIHDTHIYLTEAQLCHLQVLADNDSTELSDYLERELGRAVDAIGHW